MGSLQKAKIKAAKDKVDQIKSVITDEISKREQSILELKKERSNKTKGLRGRLASL